MSKPSKSWCFTLNNPTAVEIKLFKDISCNYGIFGEEVGESGTPHLQATITFKNATRLGALKKICARAHWEPTKALEAAENYCKKDGNFWIIDNRTQGSRTDIAGAISALKEGGIKKVIEKNPVEFVKYHAGLEKLAFRLQPQRDFKPEVYWVWGPTGTGKTRAVVQIEPDLWISGKNLQWWDGYENQEAVLLDDFRKDFCTFHELLRILDRYPYRVAVKGGFRELNSKRIYITSCYPPNEVYHTREDVNQLLRRIDSVSVTEVFNTLQL